MQLPTNEPTKQLLNQPINQTNKKQIRKTNKLEGKQQKNKVTKTTKTDPNIKPKNKFQYIPAASPCATQTRRDYYSHRWPRKSYAVAVLQEEDRDLSAPRNLRG